MKKTMLFLMVFIMSSLLNAANEPNKLMAAKPEITKAGAEEQSTPVSEDAVRMKALLETPENTSAFLHALKVLSENGDKSIIPKVIVRIEELLEEIKKPQVEPPVVVVKPDKKDKKGKKDIKSIARKAVRESSKELDIDTIEELVGVLCELKTSTPEVQAIVGRLIRENIDIRLNRIALYAMGELKFQGLFLRLIYYMGEDQPTSGNLKMRRELFWTLSKAGIKEVEPFMFRFLPDESPAVRGTIVLAFWNLKSRAYTLQLAEKAKYEQNLWVKEKMEWVSKQLSMQ